jgi:hypothetical protein
MHRRWQWRSTNIRWRSAKNNGDGKTIAAALLLAWRKWRNITKRWWQYQQRWQRKTAASAAISGVAASINGRK